jgi:monothiol glutaredoxin
MEIKEVINASKIFLMMKGTPKTPACGFSARVVRILKLYNVEFSSFNIFDDMNLANKIKEYSDWPTTPQLYVNGKLIGGCDIIEELHKNGELKNILF